MNKNDRNLTAILLVAGLGSRLGKPVPKCLNKIDGEETILARQVRILRNAGIRIMAVVGFKKDLVMEAEPQLLYVYNSEFDTTNTSKSLLCAMRHAQNSDVMWINGDVVFDEQIIAEFIRKSGSLVAVNSARVGEEEVKYALDGDGYITQISKSVAQPQGEALGINLIERKKVPAFIEKLENVDESDYFEKAMELLIEDEGQVFSAVDVSSYNCIEVDFEEDLQAAIEMLENK